MSASLLLVLGLLAAGPPSRSPIPRPLVRRRNRRAPPARARMPRTFSGRLSSARPGDWKPNDSTCWTLPFGTDPANLTARGLLGQVQVDGQWLTPEQAAGPERAGEEQAALLAEYETRRAAAADTASAQWKLALWCERHGLNGGSHGSLHPGHPPGPDEPGRLAAPGLPLYQGRWMNEEQIAAEEAEVRSQKEADQYWRPLLSRWKGWLLDPSRKAEAARELSQVHDPRAVASVLRVFEGGTRWQRWAVYVLGRIDSPVSAQALASLAVNAPARETREAAIHRLRDR